jgi:guanylate kinase
LSIFFTFNHQGAGKMLILILGPSGVGKTTMIQALVTRHHWNPITSYITRPARTQEPYKTSISQADYHALRRARKLFSDVDQLGFSYGILTEDIELAIRSDVPYVIDYAFSKRQRIFGNVRHIAIALVPETTEELRRRLDEAGRGDRAEQAFADLSSIQAEAEQSPDDGVGFIRVVNERDRIAETAQYISQLVNRT